MKNLRRNVVAEVTLSVLLAAYAAGGHAQSATDSSIDPNIRYGRLKTEEVKKLISREIKRRHIDISEMKEPEIGFYGSGMELEWRFHYSAKIPGPGMHFDLLVHDRTKKVRLVPGL